MATDFELALFAQQLEEVQVLPGARRWSLERDDSVPLGVFMTTHPLCNSQELFKARMRWDDYFKPASLKFIDMTTGSVDVTRFRRRRSTSGLKLLERKRAHLVKMTVPANSIVKTFNVIKHV